MDKVQWKKNGMAALGAFYAVGGAVVVGAMKWGGLEVDGTFVLGTLGVMSGPTMIVLNGVFNEKPGPSEDHVEKMALIEKQN